MKIKCDDGKTREFQVALFDHLFDKWKESECLLCGEQFGVHSTTILIPEFRKHVCKPGYRRKEFTVFYVSDNGIFCKDFFYADDEIEAKEKCVDKHPQMRKITDCCLGFSNR